MYKNNKYEKGLKVLTNEDLLILRKGYLQNKDEENLFKIYNSVKNLIKSLITSCIKIYRLSNIQYINEELEQLSFLGFLKAINTYKEEKKMKLSSYIYLIIRKEFQIYIAKLLNTNEYYLRKEKEQYWFKRKQLADIYLKNNINDNDLLTIQQLENELNYNSIFSYENFIDNDFCLNENGENVSNIKYMLLSNTDNNKTYDDFIDKIKTIKYKLTPLEEQFLYNLFFNIDVKLNIENYDLFIENLHTKIKRTLRKQNK